MKCTRDGDPIHQFIDIEATVCDEDEEDEEDEEDNSGSSAGVLDNSATL
jgi:hypothetical protein